MSFNARQSFKLLLESCCPILKHNDFSRRKAAFYRSNNHNYGIIDFQRSQKSSSEALMFTINLAVASARLRHPPKSRLSVWDCHWRRRVGFLLPDRRDIWWTIDANTDLQSLSTKIHSLLEEIACPEIQNHLSDEALRDMWISGVSPGLTDYERLLNLTSLLYQIGPSELIESTVDELAVGAITPLDYFNSNDRK